MSITLANVVLPQIRDVLSATHDEIAWDVTLNLVATAIATPTTGWLATRLGWRWVMLSGVVPSPPALIKARDLSRSSIHRASRA
jgi:DHA2 family multidrug resistance protein